MEIIDLTSDSESGAISSRLEQLRQRYCRPTATSLDRTSPNLTNIKDNDPQNQFNVTPHESETSAEELNISNANITIIDVDSDLPSDKLTNNTSRKRRRSTSTAEIEFAAPHDADQASPLCPVTSQSPSQSGPSRPKSSNMSTPRAPRAAMDKSKPEVFEFTHLFKLRAIQGDESISIHDEFTVMYTSAMSSLTAWIESLPPSCPLGFDTEGEGRVVQLCCLLTSKILIFVMPVHAMPSYRAQCAAVLSTVIGSESYLKVGVAAFHDAIKLGSIMLVDAARIFELTELSKDLQFNADTRDISRTFVEETRKGIIVITDDATKSNFQHGLKSLFSEMFVSQFSEIEPISGPYTEPRHGAHGLEKWTTYPLLNKDLLYAAKDALFGALLYNAFVIHYSDEEVDEKIKEAEKSFANARTKRNKKLQHKLNSNEHRAASRSSSAKTQQKKTKVGTHRHVKASSRSKSHHDAQSRHNHVRSEQVAKSRPGETRHDKKKRKRHDTNTARDGKIKREFELRQFKREPGRMLSI